MLGAALPAPLLVSFYFLFLLTSGGCVARSRSVAEPADLSATDSPLQVMTQEDRARLETLAAERANEVGDRGYVIGPDDLLAVRIPDFVEGPSSSHPVVATASNAAYLPIVAQAPVFEQGLRVNEAGKITLPLIGSFDA